jgi:hypothetical protein
MADVDDNDAATHAAIVAATDVIKMRIIIPRIHDDQDGMIILRSLLCSRHQAFLVLYHGLLCGIPQMTMTITIIYYDRRDGFDTVLLPIHVVDDDNDDATTVYITTSKFGSFGGLVQDKCFEPYNHIFCIVLPTEMPVCMTTRKKR